MSLRSDAIQGSTTKAMWRLSILVAASLVLLPADAYAYLDPGTGSLLIQILIAFFIGISVAVKIFWTYIKSVFMSLVPGSRGRKHGK